MRNGIQNRFAAATIGFFLLFVVVVGVWVVWPGSTAIVIGSILIAFTAYGFAIFRLRCPKCNKLAWLSKSGFSMVPGDHCAFCNESFIDGDHEKGTEHCSC